MSPRSTGPLVTLAAVIAAVIVAGAGWCGSQLLPAARGAEDQPPPKTIVSITGDAANGFHIEHYDGTYLFPPTDSEARAECVEYDTRLARVRCRVQVLTWYRDLAQTQQALAWAHGQAQGGGA